MSRTTFRLLVTLVVGLLVSAGTLPAGVLCVAGDGHVELERMAEACCGPHDCEIPEEGTGCSVASADEACCGPCTDIVLATSDDPGRADSRTVSPGPAPLGQPMRGLASPSRVPCRALVTAPPTFAPLALAALRTVVLTC